MNYRPMRAEQETIVRFDAEGADATVYTANPATLRKLDKLSTDHPEAYRRKWTDPNGIAARFTCQKKLIRFGKPASDARRAASLRNFTKNSPTTDDETEARPPPMELFTLKGNAK